MKRFSHFMPESTVLPLSLGFVVLLGILESMTSPDLFIFYLIPLFWVSWRRGIPSGIFIVLAIASVWVIEDLKFGRLQAQPILESWNLGSKVLFFAFLPFFISKFKKLLQHESKMAQTDSLTEALNGPYFSELLQMEIDRLTRYNRPFTLAYLDVDDFKRINDQFGHSIGDALLKALAETLQKTIRTTDILARLGGDEFALLFPETGYESAQFAIRRVQHSFLEAMKKKRWAVTLSIGMVTFENPPANKDAAIKRADQLMSMAKHGGKNRIKQELWKPIGIQSTPLTSTTDSR